MDVEALEVVAATMDDAGVWWAVAGGWAIDLWLGTQTREHHDIEVVIRRGDQRAVHGALAADWDLFALDPPGAGWRPWTGVPMEAPAFQLQARSAHVAFDLFTESLDEGRWRFRRDRRVTRGADDVIVARASGMPVVRPEVQLLYMASSSDPKNERDFLAARPRLDPAATSWLSRALRLTNPEHRWLRRLPEEPSIVPGRRHRRLRG